MSSRDKVPDAIDPRTIADVSVVHEEYDTAEKALVEVLRKARNCDHQAGETLSLADLPLITLMEWLGGADLVRVIDIVVRREIGGRDPWDVEIARQEFEAASLQRYHRATGKGDQAT